MALRCRANAARANYLCLDRPDIGFAAKACCRRRPSPATLDWFASVRLSGTWPGSRGAVYYIPWQDEARAIRTFVGAD